MLKTWTKQRLAIGWACALTLVVVDALAGQCAPLASGPIAPAHGRTAGNTTAQGESKVGKSNAGKSVAGRPSNVRYGSSVAPAGADPGYYGENGPNPTTVPMDGTRRASVITVRLPAKAELWIDGKKLEQAGNVRTWVSPGLTPEQIYTYKVRSRWIEQGSIEVEKTLSLRTFAGSQVTVNLAGAAPRSRRRAFAPVLVGGRARSRVVERQPITWNAPVP